MAITLIEQIDQLAKIAGDFSQFANIGNAHLEHFDITDSLSSVIRLHNTHPRAHIEWEQEEGDYTVYSDRVQMNRLFTNLIQNGIEANEDTSRKAHIMIRQQRQDGHILFSISDDSGGIPAHMQQNIFKPNFTTKSSGTGLGLAICKGIIEKANGSIWFESEEGKGTTFYIMLPGDRT
jgi:signal transduction histidine kinase